MALPIARDVDAAAAPIRFSPLQRGSASPVAYTPSAHAPRLLAPLWARKARRSISPLPTGRKKPSASRLPIVSSRTSPTSAHANRRGIGSLPPTRARVVSRPSVIPPSAARCAPCAPPGLRQLQQRERPSLAWRHQEVLPPRRRDEPLQAVVLLRHPILLDQIQRCLVLAHRVEEVPCRHERCELQLRLVRSVRHVQVVVPGAVHADV